MKRIDINMTMGMTFCWLKAWVYERLVTMTDGDRYDAPKLLRLARRIRSRVQSVEKEGYDGVKYVDIILQPQTEKDF
jgi:hypothetical protein